MGREVRVLAVTVLAVLACWAAWVRLSLSLPYPELNRQVIRQAILLAPAIWYVRRVERRPLLRALRLRSGFRVGLAWGLGAALVLPGLWILARGVAGGLRARIPDDPATLLGTVVVAPLAEEVFFRGVLFRRLLRPLGVASAAIVSAAAFAALHVPWFVLSGTMGREQVAMQTGTIFVYGLAFAASMRASGTLWAPLTHHAINNLALSFVAP
jgi:membrane protease YdiL (CAAX protease family)